MNECDCNNDPHKMSCESRKETFSVIYESEQIMIIKACYNMEVSTHIEVYEKDEDNAGEWFQVADVVIDDV